MVETLIAQGYEGLLLILDEVSLFMKNRTDEQRIEDEKTLVVLSNRLAKTHCLPVWTICSAQQALESKMGVKNIIANDRLKNVALLQDESNFYDIVLSRVRTIPSPTPSSRISRITTKASPGPTPSAARRSSGSSRSTSPPSTCCVRSATT